MKFFKVLVPLYLVLAMYLNGKCQTPISYYYDNGGNRTERIIYIPPVPRPPDNNDTSQINQRQEASKREYKDKIGEVNVKIYPNPTKGQLFISLSDVPQGGTSCLELFSLEGKLISKPEIDNLTYSVDLSNKPAGIYILRIKINTNISEWRIIKQ